MNSWPEPSDSGEQFVPRKCKEIKSRGMQLACQKKEKEREREVEKREKVSILMRMKNVNEIFIHSCRHRNPFAQFETLHQITHFCNTGPLW